ncbi:MAG TPA: ABC transporter permease, partial [Candidatus Solibacter sp.]|nr:ABC transporter permease [Candidatus Solibacter sp.]
MHLFSCLWQDLRFGTRNLAKGRTFTVIALGSLALGIGGSTAMYSVVYAVILHPFIYQDTDRLMSVQVQSPEGRGNGSYYAIDQFVELAERSRLRNTVFAGIIASTWSDVTWTGAGDPQRLRGNHCTMNTFDVMGVAPLVGRATMASDAADGAEPVTILGYKFWQRQFGGDSSVLGRKLELNGTLRTVIGVMPRRFMWRGADVYLPTVYRRGQTPEGVTDVHLMGRLKPGVTRAQAEADLRPILLDLQQRQPKDFPKSWRIQLQTFAETFPSGIQDALWILFGAVGLLLVIACVNVSNLLLSRASYRRREIAIRASLGASRARLVGQLLAESLVLGVAGGALGVAAAYAGLRGLIAMVPPNTIPDEAQIALNGPVLWFTLAVSMTAALLFGLAPALQLSGRDIVRPLREAGRGSSGTAGQRVLRGILVVGEVALSLMLLVGASLMIRTLISVQSQDLGFQPGRVLTLR